MMNKNILCTLSPQLCTVICIQSLPTVQIISVWAYNTSVNSMNNTSLLGIPK